MKEKHIAHTVILEFTCKPSKGSEFLKILVNALADTRAFAGCRSVETYVDQDNSDVIVLWEKLEDRPS